MKHRLFCRQYSNRFVRPLYSSWLGHNLHRVQTDPGKPGKPGKMVFFLNLRETQGNPGEKNKNFTQLRETQGILFQVLIFTAAQLFGFNKWGHSKSTFAQRGGGGGG